MDKDQTTKQETTNKQAEKARGKRLRDEKGHFLPSGAGKCSHSNKTTCPKEEDSNTVKFKIVKEKKPSVPKEIVGKLNDMNEHYASRFIQSIIVNDPDSIDINGKKYYGKKVVDGLHKEIEEATSETREAFSCMSEMEHCTDNLLVASKKLLHNYNEECIWRVRWKCLALGMLTGTAIFWILKGAVDYTQSLERNAPKAALTPSAAR